MFGSGKCQCESRWKRDWEPRRGILAGAGTGKDGEIKSSDSSRYEGMSLLEERDMAAGVHKSLVWSESLSITV